MTAADRRRAWVHFPAPTCPRARTATSSSRSTTSTTAPAGPACARWPGQAGVSHTTVSKMFSAPAVCPPGEPSSCSSRPSAAAPRTSTPLARGVHARRRVGPVDAPHRRPPGRSWPPYAAHLDSGTGLLLVTGEAGMGKTTVVDAAARATDTFVATAHCLPLAMEVPLLPIADGLTAVHDVEGGVWLEEALDGLPDFVRQSAGAPAAPGRHRAAGRSRRCRPAAPLHLARHDPGPPRRAAPVRAGAGGPALGGPLHARPGRAPPRQVDAGAPRRHVADRGPGDTVGDAGLAGASPALARHDAAGPRATQPG